MLYAMLPVLPAIVASAACQPQPPLLVVTATSEQLPVLQAELGYTAVSLTLSDCSTAEIAAIRAALLQTPAAAELLAARSAAADAERQLFVAKEGTEASTPAQIAEAQRLLSDLTLAQARVGVARAAVSSAVRAAVTTVNWAAFDRVAGAPTGLPASLRVLDWPPAELANLAAALERERRAHGELSLISQADRDCILAARGSPAVTAAVERLAARLTVVARALRGLSS